MQNQDGKQSEKNFDCGFEAVVATSANKHVALSSSIENHRRHHQQPPTVDRWLKIHHRQMQKTRLSHVAADLTCSETHMVSFQIDYKPIEKGKR